MSGPIFIRLFVHSRKHKLIWCQNLKVGTTTWIDTTLSEISKKTERKRIMMYFRTRLKDLRFLDDEKYTSFSIVRHPFERLVSAYYDFSHLKRRGKRYQKMSFDQFARSIVKSAKRCWPSLKCLNSHFLPFSTACSYCDNNYKGKISSYYEYTGN